MLDLETMGNKTGCAIVSIGAVKFSRERGVLDRFYVGVDLQSCLRARLEIDAETVLWWMKQSDDARKVLTNGAVLLLSDALFQFKSWLWHDNHFDFCVWGNGSDFDNAIIASAFAAVDMPLPWKFWRNRCYRTLKALAPEIEIERSGTHHNAVDDAESQALHLIRILQSLHTF